MRCRITSSSGVIVTLSLIFFLFPPLDAPSQTTNFDSSLRGEYNVALTRSCWIQSPNNPGFGAPWLSSTNGKFVFDGQGGLSFSGIMQNPDGPTPILPAFLSTGGGGVVDTFVADINGCNGTYAVSADGSFAGTMNCNLTFTASSNNQGDTAELNGVRVKGRLSLDGTVLVIQQAPTTVAEIETLNCQFCNGPNGEQDLGLTMTWLCNATGVATSRR